MAATLDTPIVLSSSSPAQALAAIHNVSVRHISSSPAFEPLPSPSAVLRRHAGQMPLRDAIQGDTISARWPQSKETPGAADAHGEQTQGKGKGSVKLRKPRQKKEAVGRSENQASLGAGATDAGAGENADDAVASIPKSGVKRKRPAKTPTDAAGAPRPRKRAAKAKVLEGGGAGKDGVGSESNKPAAKNRRKKAPQHNEAEDGEVSYHFAGGDRNDETDGVQQRGKAKGTGRALSPVDLGLSAAPPRRRSWTPLLGEELPPSNQQGSDDSQPTGAAVNPDMLEQFVYQDNGETAAKRAKTADPAPTRRTKIEGTDVPGPPKRKRAEKKEKAAAVKKPREPKKPKPPKKPREPKIKRPKTITDYAISAYRKVPERDEKAVSDFFQPTSTQIVRLENDPSSILEPEHIVKAAAKRLTTTVQFQFPEPAQARQKMQEQDFLFGTSSQLAKEESPRTHRMVQQAIRESEDLAFASQALSSDVERSPTTSRVRVVNAPHGTSLSVGPGESNLWMSAARDQEARMFASTPRVRAPAPAVLSSPRILSPLPLPEADYAADDEPSSRNKDAERAQIDPSMILQPVADTEVSEAQIGSVAHDMMQHAEDLESQHDSGFVDISDIEAANEVKAVPGPEKQSQAAQQHVAMNNSDEPVLVSSSPPIIVASRPVLKSLDVNTSIVKPLCMDGPKLSSTAPLASPSRSAAPAADDRPRGRPRKTSLALDNQLIEEPAKRPVGRPRKSSLTELTNDTVRSPPKKRGRPRKDATIPTFKATASDPAILHRRTSDTGAVSTPKRVRKTAAIPSSSNSRNWHDIDEISDSEPSLPALSPPRRSASSPPSSPRKLDLIHGTSKPSESVVVAPASTVLTEEQIQSRKAEEQAALFKAISRTVKSAPRTRDPSRPSWYEKMLLYDPIVLEDLTGWLVEQGIQVGGSDGEKVIGMISENAGAGDVVETRAGDKSQGKGRGKGKSKAKVIESDGKKGELQPWMVQKWCEANSICCLWKEGLRGGVRQRY
ncbi:Peptidyl-prolyl cis-trans isomerase [Sphaceloma murrayae]|uniref:Structure-specific endonuclease subunit SLX4 n=1 Tax=Sphaceloma murrayae TaxID=2082308 RepID=A0A2K1QFL9_9PEZI|nr:Peptidyl-prolyl cis-trans isomerase [Sphaceloma murrayae]